MQAQDHLFVVGTEEGHIHKCSQAYNSEYLQTYQGNYTENLAGICNSKVAILCTDLLQPTLPHLST